MGYRYYEKEGIKPAYPFGYGLSYTDFILENAVVKSIDAEQVILTVDVCNVGETAGAEVVQCYVTDCECSVERPVKELKAYSKVFLQPGEVKSVSLVVPRKGFAFYDVSSGGFVVEPGEFVLQLGTSSDNCRRVERKIVFGKDIL